MPISLETKENQFRTIYELLWFRNPRIYVKDVASSLNVDPRTASNRIREAIEREYIIGPQIRKRSYANLKEYICLASCKDPLETYFHYLENTDVTYLAVLEGIANFLIISKKKININGAILIEGFRSDYYISFAPNRSWKKAIEIMQHLVKTFDPHRYEPKNIITVRWDTFIDWDTELEQLYQYFKHNLRKPFSPIMKKHLITTGKIYTFLKRLHEHCTVLTSFYPKTISAYDPYLFVFETNYEDFVINLFSQLPTSVLFFKVSNFLFLHVRVDKQLLRSSSFLSEVDRLHIALLVRELSRKGIVKNKMQALFGYHYEKSL